MIRTCCMIFFGLALIAGCLGQPSSPSRFYLLEEIKGDFVVPADKTISSDEYLQVGPIMLPRYLDRPQIVSRVGGNQLTLGEFDRWSEPLQTSFTRVIAGNLSKLLGSSNILIYPNRGPAEDDFYQLRMEVTRFDGSLAGEVELTVRWTIVGRHNSKVMAQVSETHKTRLDGEGYPAYVDALNRVLTQLSRSIAERIAVETEKSQTAGS